MLKKLLRRFRPDEYRETECMPRCCPTWSLYAKAAKERDVLAKENEELRQKVTILMAEQEIGNTSRNTYQELERAWGNF